MLSQSEIRFINSRRVAHLATADARGAPHVMPICFALEGETLYSAIDEKPKRIGGPPLKRLRNIDENPSVAVVLDRYNDDWSLLGWVMLRGHADILLGEGEHARAQELLRNRYSQLQSMRIASLAVIALRIERVTSWGNLRVDLGARASDT